MATDEEIRSRLQELEDKPIMMETNSSGTPPNRVWVVHEVERICGLRGDRVPQLTVIFGQAKRTARSGIPYYAILQDDPFFDSSGASKNEADPKRQKRLTGSSGSGGSGAGGSGGESKKSSDSDFTFSDTGDDMAALLRGDKNKIEKADEVKGKCSLKQLYAEAYPTVNEVDDDAWAIFLGGIDIEGFVEGLLEFCQSRRGDGDEETMIALYLAPLNAAWEYEEDILLTEKLRTILKLDYSHSPLGWEAYKADFTATDNGELYRRLREACSKGFKEKIIVDSAKRNRLVQCISVAIKIGLNYQELAKFDPQKHIPPTEDMTVDDLNKLGVELEDPELEEGKTYFSSDKLIPKSGLRKLGLKKVMSFNEAKLEAKLKKVKVADVHKHPYWEKIRARRGPDLGEYISLWGLTQMPYRQYINPTKRETLTKIYKTFDGYDINLDKAEQLQLKSMCRLDTLKLAPRVHKAVCENGNIEEAFREWQASDRSYKLLGGDVLMKEEPYIKLIKETQDLPGADVVEQVLGGDFTNLDKIIKGYKHDNHDNKLSSNPLVLSGAPPDADFAQKLSNAFIELGFLPPGVDPRYCGVKPGEVRGKRSSGGAVNPAKRHRAELFTPIEIH